MDTVGQTGPTLSILPWSRDRGKSRERSPITQLLLMGGVSESGVPFICNVAKRGHRKDGIPSLD